MGPFETLGYRMPAMKWFLLWEPPPEIPFAFLAQSETNAGGPGTVLIARISYLGVQTRNP